jgi:hypothetical protein
MRAAGGSDLPCSCSGDGVGGSPMYLRQRGKHQWQWRTPAILPRRLVRRGRQHKGVVVAKTVARVRARFGWGKLLRMAPYIGKLVPSTHNRCGLQSYMISILSRTGFGWRSQGTVGFPSRRWHKLGSISVLCEDNGVVARPAWTTHWPLGREVGRGKNRKWGGERRGRMGRTQIPTGFRPVAK